MVRRTRHGPYARKDSYKIPKPRKALRPAFFLLLNCRFQIIVMPKTARAKSTKEDQPFCNVSSVIRLAHNLIRTGKRHIEMVRYFWIPAFARRGYPKRLWWRALGEDEDDNYAGCYEG